MNKHQLEHNERVLLCIAGAVVFFVIASFAVLIESGESHNAYCETHGGIYVKTYNGHACIVAKVVQVLP